MKEIKVVIAGGRDFNEAHYQSIMKPALTKFLLNLKRSGLSLTVVSGKAPGADHFGEKFAWENNLKIKEFPANWAKYGKSAGPIRNEQMAKYADGALVFWDGKSRGSQNMISQAKKYNLKLKVFNY